MHPSHETLNDYVDGALGASTHADVERHMQTCADCALVVAELQHIVQGAAALPPVAPPAHVWAQLEARVEEPRRSEGQRAEGAGQRTVGKGQGSRSWGPTWALATAALVIIAFLTGRIIEQRKHPVESQQAASPAAQPAQADAKVRERVLLVAVGDHLERSQMVLVELANAQTRGELDISAERQWADDLLASNRLYRQTAAEMGESNVANVLDDLERVLVEVARGPSQVSMQQLAEIQQRIESQGILFKVRIIGSDMRGRTASSERKPL